MADISEPSVPVKTTGRKSINYRAHGVRFMLDLIEKVLPMGADEWERISVEYNQWAETSNSCERLNDALKKKFDRLNSSKKPTGDPTCPPDVKRAKRIQRRIMEKAEVEVSHESDPEDQGSESDNNILEMEDNNSDANDGGDSDGGVSTHSSAPASSVSKKRGSTFASGASDSAKKAKANAVLKTAHRARTGAVRASRVSSADVFAKILSEPTPVRSAPSPEVSKDTFTLLQQQVQNMQNQLNAVQQQVFQLACKGMNQYRQPHQPHQYEHQFQVPLPVQSDPTFAPIQERPVPDMQ